MVSEVNFIRAVACLLVVLVHVTAIRYTPEHGFPDYFTLVLNQISRLGTPLFAVVSAFLLFYSVRKKGFLLKKFIVSRTTKVVFPFLVWSLIYLCFQKWYLGYDAFAVDWYVFIFSYLILGGAFYHLYFIAAIVQFYLLFPVLQLIRSKKFIIVLFFISLPLNYISLNINDMSLFNESSMLYEIVSLRPFILNWISFFLFGALLAYWYEEIIEFMNKNSRNNVLLTTVLISVLTVGIFSDINPYQYFSSSRPANLLYIPLLAVILIGLHQALRNNRVISTIFGVVGMYSMGIFLVHPMILILLKELLPRIMWLPYLLLITFTLAVVISIIVIKIIRMLPFSQFIVSVPLSGVSRQKYPRTVHYKNKTTHT